MAGAGSGSRRRQQQAAARARAPRLQDALALLAQLGAAHEGVAGLVLRDVLDLLDLRLREALDVQHLLRCGVLDVRYGVQAGVAQLLDVGRGDALVGEDADLRAPRQQRRDVDECQAHRARRDGERQRGGGARA